MNAVSTTTGAGGAVVLSATSLAGPFAAGVLTIGAVKTPVRNATDAPLNLVSARVSPLVSERTGLSPAAGELGAEVTRGPIGLGETAWVTIGGTVPARPGAYLAELDVLSGSGAVIAIPIRVEVAASPLWGVACLLFGLSLIGLLGLLTGAGDVEETTRETLLERAAIHDEWVRDPPPSSRADMVAAIDQNIDDAVRSLAAGRGFSVVDRRIANASAAMASARQKATELREAMSKTPSGAAEAVELEQEWDAFRPRLAALATPVAAPGPPRDGIAGHAAALLAKARAGLLASPANWVEADIGEQVDRVRFALAAGEAPRAQAMALATGAWMRRAADDLEKRLSLQIGLALTADAMETADGRVRRLAEDSTIPPDARTNWTARLDAADEKLASGSTLADFAEAVRIVDETDTQSMRDQEGAMLVRLKQAEDAAGEELSLSVVNAEFVKLGPPGRLSAADRAAGVARAFEAWRASLELVHDEAARARLATAIDSGVAAAGRQDTDGMKEAMKAAQAEWRAYTPKHIAAAGAAVVGPVCIDWRDRSLRQLAVAEGQVKLQSGRPEVANWDKRLDRAKRALQAVAADDVDCMGRLTTAAAEVNRVSQEAFQRLLEDSPIPLSARLDAAERSGDAVAVAAIQRLMSEPRDLQLTAETAEADIVVGQPVLFTLANLDPNWGSGVDVSIDWGDGSTTLPSNAETLRQGGRIEHVYRAIGTVHPTATANDGAETVGKSQSEIFVRPSPATAAERAADIFLSAQFWLALLIASVVYYWRFHSGTITFGANSVHYVLAFALGFAAYAAVADLPKALAEIALR